jgi:hypothetical protein
MGKKEEGESGGGDSEEESRGYLMGIAALRGLLADLAGYIALLRSDVWGPSRTLLNARRIKKSEFNVCGRLRAVR